MRQGHEALLSIRVFSNVGLELIKSILQEIQQYGEVDRVSSVFKVNRVYSFSQHVHDLRHQEHFIGLSIAVLLQTELSSKELMSAILKMERGERVSGRHNHVKINLLTYDDNVKMTPSLTIPHPNFHLKPEEVYPAAEIYGDYLHPVLNSNLTALSRKSQSSGWGEFFAQGKSLLNDEL